MCAEPLAICAGGHNGGTSFATLDQDLMRSTRPRLDWAVNVFEHRQNDSRAAIIYILTWE